MIYPNPAAAIQARLGGTQSQTAALLGTTVQQWNRYVNGNRDAGVSKVLVWCERLGMRLEATPNGWRAHKLRGGLDASGDTRHTESTG